MYVWWCSNFARFCAFSRSRKATLTKKKRKTKPWKNPSKKKNIINIVRGCSNEKEQSCALSFVVVSLPRHSSLNRLLDQLYTASLVFSSCAPCTRVPMSKPIVETCLSRDLLLSPIRGTSVNRAWFFVRENFSLWDNELHRLGDRRKIEKSFQTREWFINGRSLCQNFHESFSNCHPYRIGL